MSAPARLRRLAAATAAAALLLAAAPAAAHEVLHEVVRGRAVAVRATYADGEPLAYSAYEIFSPADPRIAFQKGRTDRNGWLAFVPDGKGAWRVRVDDGTGHGLDASIPVDEAGAPAAGGGQPGLLFVLRPAIGAAIVGAIFLALLAWRRRRGTP